MREITLPPGKSTYVSDGGFAITHRRHSIMRAHAQIALFWSCLVASQSSLFAADINSSGKDLGQAKIEKKNLGTIAFRPELSLQQNNQSLQQHRTRSATASIEIVDAGRYAFDSSWVNRPVRFQYDQHVYSGRISSIMIGAQGQPATLFATLDVAADQPRLTAGQRGQLSVVK
jgi:hypothetical protein